MQPPEALSERERFTAGDRRLVVAAVAIIAASSLYVRANYRAAFPQASLDLRYSREQITTRAESFLRGRGLSTSGFLNLTLFDADDNARLFLEREAGLQEANRLMQREVAVWRWRARWYKPPEKEEFRVWLAPDARLVGFEHVIDETASGAGLSQAEARRLAEEFLKSQSRLEHRLVEERLEEKPNRHDFVFTWEQQGFKVHEATYRRTVVVHGDRIGSYREFLQVPEQWRRDFAALRSKNELYTQVAQAFYIPLILGAIIVHIQAIRRRRVPWRPLVLLCAVVGALMIATQWNNLPFFLDSMPTSTPLPESIGIGLLQGLGAGVGVFFYVMLAAAPGEPLYRASYPSFLSLPAALSRPGLQTREFFRASVTGYAMAAFHIAFVVAFYLVGRRFGVWSPQDVEYSDLLSTALPWLYPLTISLLASTSEEFWFRLLAIPLLKRLTGSNWIAVLLPAFVWGFLHANYPQQPGYIRGIEVGLIGVVAGVVMLRYGILATLIWHYTVDAVLIGTYLLAAQSWYFRISGLLVAGAVLFPLAISLVRYRRNGGFLRAAGLTNAALAPPPEDKRAEVPAPPPAEPLAAPAPLWPRHYLYIAAGVALAGGLLLKGTRYGSFIEARVDRESALASASRAFADLGRKPAEWRTVVDFLPNLDGATFEYLRRQRGPDQANAIVRERTLHGIWRVNYFRDQQKEEWYVYVNQRGDAFRTDHVIDEKAPGANLTGEAARRIAEQYLSGKQGMAVERYRLVDSSSERRDKRTDHYFTWEDTGFRAGEATARVSLTLVGDEPSNFRRFVKLPEQWVRDFNRVRIRSFLLPALGGGVFITILVVFIRRLAGHPFRWRLYVTLSVAALAIAVASRINQLPTFYAGYDTAIPLRDYVNSSILGALIGVLLTGFGAFLGALAIDIFLRLGLARRPLPRPTLWNAAAIAGVFFGFPRIVAGIAERIPGDRASLPLWDLPGASTLAPSFSVVASAFWSALVWCLLAGILLPVAARILSPRALVIWIVLAAGSFSLSVGDAPLLIAFYFVATLVFLGLVLLLCLTCSADILSLAPALFFTHAAGAAATLLAQPAAWLRWHGAVALAVALLVTLVWLWRAQSLGETTFSGSSRG